MNISSNDVALSGQNCNVFVNRLPPFVECKWRAYHVECPEASLTVYSIHVAWFRVKSLSTMTLQTSSQTQTLVYKFIAQKLFLGNPSVAVCVCVLYLCAKVILLMLLLLLLLLLLLMLLLLCAQLRISLLRSLFDTLALMRLALTKTAIKSHQMPVMSTWDSSSTYMYHSFAVACG